MGRRVTFASEEYYHLYNRGTEKRNVFLDHADYTRFLTYLYLCNGKNPVHQQLQKRELHNLYEHDRGDSLVDIGAFCLMPNHFHILAKEKIGNGISSFMQKLSTGYTMYFNKRYERTGALFQGRFKSTHATNDEYLKYLFSYIHLNPVKLIEPKWREQGILDKETAISFLESYKHSSYPDYLGIQRVESRILSKDSFPEYFVGPSEFFEQNSEWLADFDSVEVQP